MEMDRFEKIAVVVASRGRKASITSEKLMEFMTAEALARKERDFKAFVDEALRRGRWADMEDFLEDVRKWAWDNVTNERDTRRAVDWMSKHMYGLWSRHVEDVLRRAKTGSLLMTTNEAFRMRDELKVRARELDARIARLNVYDTLELPSEDAMMDRRPYVEADIRKAMKMVAGAGRELARLEAALGVRP